MDDRPWQGPAPPAVIYRYAEDRRGRHVKEHLDGFHGVLQVDAYAGYDDLAKPDRPGGAITLAYCLAHARREFFDVYKRTKEAAALEALRRIGEVYAIEARIRGRTAEERVAVRQAEIKPLMTAFWSWLMDRLAEISAKSSLAGAIRYTLNQWNGLTVFLADGRVEVDNNTVERSIRPIPLGRKNALFAGSDGGASYCPSGDVLIKPENFAEDREISGVLTAVPRHHGARRQAARQPAGLSRAPRRTGAALEARRWSPFGRLSLGSPSEFRRLRRA